MFENEKSRREMKKDKFHLPIIIIQAKRREKISINNNEMRKGGTRTETHSHNTTIRQFEIFTFQMS